MKVDMEFSRQGFLNKKTVDYYSRTVSDIGLWNSEKKLIEEYFPLHWRILDLGCGAGRTTLGLYNLGYENLLGMDLSSAMIDAARNIARKKKMPVEFQTADAVSLPLTDASFDGVLFSYNGFMQIPGVERRKTALSEICRVLSPGGIFIFTTHDMQRAGEYREYWENERRLWDIGEQDSRLLEFGDMIISEREREFYLHIPTRREIMECLRLTGFELLGDWWRPEVCDERSEVRAYSNDNRFWVAKKEGKG